MFDFDIDIHIKKLSIMKKIFTAFLFLTVAFVNAQGNTNEVEKHQFKANLLLTPGIEYEVGLNKKTTLDFRLGTGLIYVKSNDEEEYGVFLTFEGAYRYYYNFEKRARKGKKTSDNSANYIALTSLYTNLDPILGDIDINDSYLVQVGPVWGFQRTYNSGLNLGLDLGVGFASTDDYGIITPIVNFRLGWAFGK